MNVVVVCFFIHRLPDNSFHYTYIKCLIKKAYVEFVLLIFFVTKTLYFSLSLILHIS